MNDAAAGATEHSGVRPRPVIDIARVRDFGPVIVLDHGTTSAPHHVAHAQLPALAASVLGYVPATGDVAALCSSNKGTVAAVLSSDMDAAGLRKIVGATSETPVHIVGFGHEALAQSHAWWRALELTDPTIPSASNSLPTVVVCAVEDGCVNVLDPLSPAVPFPTEPVVAGPYTAADRMEAVTRLSACLPDEVIPVGDIEAAAHQVAAARWDSATKVNVAIAALGKLGDSIRDDTTPAHVDLDGATVDVRALVATLVDDPAVASKVATHVGRHSHLVDAAILIARTCPPAHGVGALEVAAHASWAHGATSFGPISTGTIAGWIEPAVPHSVALAGLHAATLAGVEGAQVSAPISRGGPTLPAPGLSSGQAQPGPER